MKIRRAMIGLAALGVLAAGAFIGTPTSCRGPIPAATGGSAPRSVDPPAPAPPTSARCSAPPEATTEVIPTADPVIAGSRERFDAELSKMNEKHWIEERLATFKPPFTWPEPRSISLPRPETEAFGDGLRGKLREPAKAAVQVAMGPEQHPSVRENAWQLLAELEEMAILPLAEARFPDAGDRVRAATIAVEAELALRAKIAASVQPMLADRAHPALDPQKPVDRMSSEEMEEHFESYEIVHRKRFCDAAFWLMRTLRHPGEDRDARWTAETAYYHTGESERDRVIEQARASGVYNAAIGAASSQR